MTTPEVQGYLPESRDPAHAFDRVNRAYFRIRKAKDVYSLPDERLIPVMSDYLKASVGHFANHSKNPYFEELGDLALQSLTQNRTLVRLSFDPSVDALQFGFSEEDTKNIPHAGDPNLALIFKGESWETTQANLLLQPAFILWAKTMPVETLSTTAFTLSLIRDYETGRCKIDPQFMNRRAEATQAQFLLDTLAARPKLVIDEGFMGALKTYPQGLESLNKVFRY